MSFCAFIGDSIAVGLAIAAHAASPQCDATAVVGRSTPAIIRHLPRAEYRIAYISAGSNDMVTALLRQELGKNLFSLRSKVNAAQVVWIVPANGFAAERVLEVARYFGDTVVGFVPGEDHLHPKSYTKLWLAVRRKVEDGDG